MGTKYREKESFQMAALIIIVVVILILLEGGVLGFNGLVRRRNRTQEAWSEIDVELSGVTTSSRTWSRPSRVTPLTSARPSKRSPRRVSVRSLPVRRAIRQRSLRQRSLRRRTSLPSPCARYSPLHRRGPARGRQARARQWRTYALRCSQPARPSRERGKRRGASPFMAPPIRTSPRCCSAAVSDCAARRERPTEKRCTQWEPHCTFLPNREAPQ